tara:strand:- start:5689 stop:5970 length:282 start_codon:yes stop_codon:yes gene_type:complete
MSTNLLGDYIWKRLQKDNIDPEFRKSRPQEMMTGLFVGPSDIQRYIDDYFNYGIDYTGNDECADDYDPGIVPFPNNPSDRIDKYWDDADGKEE